MDFFKLQEQPFDNTRDTRFFYESEGHAEALSRLLYLLKDRNMGMGMLTGEVGCGKTMTRSVLHKRLNSDRYKIVSVENCLLDFDSLLLEIISQMLGERLRVEDLPDRYTRLAAFKKILSTRIAGAGKHLVIMLDEAQHLQPMDLEGVKGLTNISSERENFSTVILIGQPDLRQKIRNLPQIDQRISLRYHLNPLTVKDTLEYLKHRLEVAGLRSEMPFTVKAVYAICRESEGVPRNINRICKLAIEHADANDLEKIDTDTVALIVRDLRRQEGMPGSVPELL